MLPSSLDPRRRGLRGLALVGFLGAALVFGASASAEHHEGGLGHAALHLQKQGAAPHLAKVAARHVLFGMPSAASLKDERDYLLVKKGSVVSYNARRNAMNWASWVVEKGDLGEIERQRYILDEKTGERLPVFRPDDHLPAHFYKPVSADYILADGWSRGHMLRSGERTASVEENRMTFVFSNMLPQSVNNNSGPWNDFENYYRDRVTKDGYVAHVIAGGVFGKPNPLARKVAVPSETWKIVALLKPGQSIEHVDAQTRVMAVRMPNDNERIQVDDDWQQYRTSVADLEKATGLHFFANVEPQIAAVLKAKVDDVHAGAREPRKLLVRGYHQQIPAKLVSAGLKGVVKAYLPDKAYGFITLEDGREVFFHRSERLTAARDGDQVLVDLHVTDDGRLECRRVKSLHPLATHIEGAE